MSYSLSSEDRFLGDVATNTGYDMLIAAAEKTEYPAIKKFFDRGETSRPKAVAGEIEQWLKKDDLPNSLRVMLEGLKFLLGKAKELAIIHD